MCGRSHIGSNSRHRYSRVGAINNKRGTQWELLKLYTCATTRGGAKNYGRRLRSAHDPTNRFQHYALAHEAFHKESQTTHTTPIVSQSSLRAVWVAHQKKNHNLSLTPTQWGRETKRRLRVPNPDSRHHATKRGFQSGGGGGITNGPQVGPVAVRSGKTIFVG